MTSFDFVYKCGKCHPGGGPMEYDREGHRYDAFMQRREDLTPGGDNGLDGDYFRARWSDSGVVEADCLLCHQPEYRFSARNAQLDRLNFRWAATVGAGLGTVQGSVKAGGTVTVTYDRSRFNPDGTVTLHTVAEPRNETCLRCHGKSDWKKRGASYSPRTDVHMAKGLRCVDCHAGGSQAADPRVRGWEVHQFGKGDDPSGFVRNDLDDTVRSCDSCHSQGLYGAPIARHAWLPPLHLERIACQTCHIPWRHVKAAAVQAGDVFNPGPHIAPAGKHVWTFYDPAGRYWNHYGDNTLMHRTDQPTDRFRPELIRYKGKIYPVNRVHSAFIGLAPKGGGPIAQMLMKDVFKMWKMHRAAPKTRYPSLSRIRDDNQDGVVEVNRPDEIDALLTAARAYLKDTKFPLGDRTVVWVSDEQVYSAGNRHRRLSKAEWEASPYASVFKYSHDVAPARSALGAGGCTDCHSAGGDFFTRPMMVRAFDGKGHPVWMPAYRALGIAPTWVQLGFWREAWVKPLALWLLALGTLLLGLLGLRGLLRRGLGVEEPRARWIGWALAGAGTLALALLAALDPGLLGYMTASRFTLDANHFWLAALTLALSLGAVLTLEPGQAPLRRLWRPLRWFVLGAEALAGVTGVGLLLKLGGLSGFARLCFFGFDLAVALAALGLAATAAVLLAGRAAPATESTAAHER